MNISVPFISILLQGIPEQVSVTFLAFLIARVPIKWSIILCVGSGLAFITYIARLFPIPFGIHTILLVFVLFIILVILTNLDISLSFTASLLSYLALIILETICLSVLMPIFNVTPEIFLTNKIVRIGLGEVQVVLLFIFSLAINEYSKGIF